MKHHRKTEAVSVAHAKDHVQRKGKWWVSVSDEGDVKVLTANALRRVQQELENGRMLLPFEKGAWKRRNDGLGTRRSG